MLVAVFQPSGLRFESAGLADSRLSYIQCFEGPLNKKRARKNPRASGAAAGEKSIRDERSCSERIDFSPAAGDLLIACRSVVLSDDIGDRFSTSSICLFAFCVFAGAAGWAGALCVLCGSNGGWVGRKSKIRVPNSEFRSLCLCGLSVDPVHARGRTVSFTEGTGSATIPSFGPDSSGDPLGGTCCQPEHSPSSRSPSRRRSRQGTRSLRSPTAAVIRRAP